MRVLIPARLESTRLPRKLLRDVAGATVIRRCVDGLLAQGFEVGELLIVTDSEMIGSEVVSWSLGVECTLRNFDATCGTQRVHEFLAQERIDCGRVIIWQADEIIEPWGDAILHDFFEGLPSGVSYNFYSSWDFPEFPEGGVQVCGSDLVSGFTRTKLKVSECIGLHAGVYLLEASFFTEFPLSIWESYSDNIEMNALLAQNYPLYLRELPVNHDRNVVQVNTAVDLELAYSIFSEG